MNEIKTEDRPYGDETLPSDEDKATYPSQWADKFNNFKRFISTIGEKKEVYVSAQKETPLNPIPDTDAVRKEKEALIEVLSKKFDYESYYEGQTAYESQQLWENFHESKLKALEKASRDFMKEKDFVLSAVEKDPENIQYADPSFKDDVDVMRQVVWSRPIHLDGSTRLNDPEFVKVLLEHNTNVFLRIGDELQSNKKFLSEVLDINPSCFRHFPDELKGDFSIAEKAVIKDSGNFQFVSEKLSNSAHIYEIAVKNNPLNIKFASERIRGDKHLVMDAIEKITRNGHQSCGFLEECSEELKGDRDVVNAMLEINPFDFQYASDEIRSDRDLAVKVLLHGDRWGHTYDSLPENLRNDREICELAVKGYGGIIFMIPEKLISKELVLLAIAEDGRNIEAAPQNFKNDLDFAYKCVQANPATLDDFSRDIKNDKELVLHAVKTHGSNELGEGVRITNYASEEIGRLVGDGDALAILTKAINAEKLSASLSRQLSLKQSRVPERKLKL